MFSFHSRRLAMAKLSVRFFFLPTQKLIYIIIIALRDEKITKHKLKFFFIKLFTYAN